MKKESYIRWVFSNKNFRLIAILISILGFLLCGIILPSCIVSSDTLKTNELECSSPSLIYARVLVVSFITFLYLVLLGSFFVYWKFFKKN